MPVMNAVFMNTLIVVKPRLPYLLTLRETTRIRTETDYETLAEQAFAHLMCDVSPKLRKARADAPVPGDA